MFVKFSLQFWLFENGIAATIDTSADALTSRIGGWPYSNQPWDGADLSWCPSLLLAYLS